MAANMAVDRADIHTGAAADALQGFVKLAAKNIGAAVVHDHQMEVFRTIRLPGRRGSDDGNIAG
ncbi:hypothetical protein D3C81_2315090 [compost metagenome]